MLFQNFVPREVDGPPNAAASRIKNQRSIQPVESVVDVNLFRDGMRRGDDAAVLASDLLLNLDEGGGGRDGRGDDAGACARQHELCVCEVRLEAQIVALEHLDVQKAEEGAEKLVEGEDGGDERRVGEHRREDAGVERAQAVRADDLEHRVLGRLAADAQCVEGMRCEECENVCGP